MVDRVGGKAALAFGLVGFLITSLACGLAPNTKLLIIFRVLQGATATALIPASLSLINQIFTDTKQRARAIGIWAGVGGLAAASGPVLCSLLTSFFSWRSIFIVNTPIVLITLTLLYKVIKVPKNAPCKQRFDWAGMLFIIIFSLSLAFSLIEAGNYGWGSALILGSLAISLLGFISFLFTEKRAKNPLIPLEIFNSKPFSLSVVVGFIISCIFYGELFLLPLYFSRIKHYGVTKIGFAILPLVALIAASSYFSGKLVSHIGEKIPLMIGFLVVILGLIGLLTTIEYSLSYYYMILPLSTVGLGLSFVMPAATHIAISSVPGNRSGMASGVFTTARQMGGLIGVAVLGSIALNNPSFLHGLHITFVIGIALATMGLALSLSLKK